MKKVLIIFAIAASFACSQGSLLNLYEYQLSVNSLLKTKSGKIGFALLKPVKNAKEENIFGYWFSKNTNSNAVFLEIKEGNKTIASITAKDFAAKAKLQGSSAVYKSGTGANAIDIVIEAFEMTNALLPLSKAIAVNVKAKAQANKNLAAVLSLFADGYAVKVGANGVSNSRVEKGKAEYPVILVTGNEGTTVEIDGTVQKTPGKTIQFISKPVATSGSEVTLLSLTVNASTVKEYEKSMQQVKNIEAAISSKKEITELAIINTANKQNPFPGDTITYTITYHNIGNAFAQDIVVTNPIPENMMYVEGSAKGENAAVTVVRKQAAPPQQGEVESVQWKITKRIYPGEEGTVTMKAIVK